MQKEEGGEEELEQDICEYQVYCFLCQNIVLNGTSSVLVRKCKFNSDMCLFCVCPVLFHTMSRTKYLGRKMCQKVEGGKRKAVGMNGWWVCGHGLYGHL